YLSVISSTYFSSNHHLHFFFFTDPATPDIYTLSLHDALPIWQARHPGHPGRRPADRGAGARVHAVHLHRLPADVPPGRRRPLPLDRKSTRLNSSHLGISYAVFCLKKKKKK